MSMHIIHYEFLELKEKKKEFFFGVRTELYSSVTGLKLKVVLKRLNQLVLLLQEKEIHRFKKEKKRRESN